MKIFLSAPNEINEFIKSSMVNLDNSCGDSLPAEICKKHSVLIYNHVLFVQENYDEDLWDDLVAIYPWLSDGDYPDLSFVIQFIRDSIMGLAMEFSGDGNNIKVKRIKLLDSMTLTAEFEHIVPK